MAGSENLWKMTLLLLAFYYKCVFFFFFLLYMLFGSSKTSMEITLAKVISDAVTRTK